MARFVEFNQSRTYGVEIEVDDNINRSAICKALRDIGIEAYVESYNHSTRSHWKFITDGSCGYELVSPPLKGYEGFEQIKKVCKVLNAHGAKVNKFCGLHVHHDASDYELDHFKNLYIAYIKYEELIDTLVPKSRRGNENGYCKSLRGQTRGLDNRAMINMMVEERFKQIKACRTLSDIHELVYRTRYYKLNTHSYVNYGTIEFRQHSGTIDAEKIINWIKFTQLMVEKAKEGVRAKIEREYDHLGCLFNLLGIVRKATCSEEMFQLGKYYRKRARELAKEERNRRAA